MTAVAVAPAQRAVLLDAMAERDTRFYNISVAYAFDGTGSVEELRDAVTAVLRSEPALRARIGVGPEGLVQHLDVAEATCEVIDDGDAAGLEQLRDWTLEPFDLGRGPLVRARIVADGAEGGVLAIAFHHAIGDGGASAALGARLGEALEGAGSEASASRWSDYASYPAEARALEEAALAGAGPLVRDLQDDEWQPPQPSGSPARAGLVADIAADELRAVATAMGTTPFALLCAAAASSVHGLTGATCVRLGVPHSVRGFDPRWHDLMGMFVTTSVITLAPAATPLETLTATSDALMDSLDGAGLGLDRLAAVVGRKAFMRGAARPFDVLVTMHERETAWRGGPFDLHPLRIEGAAPEWPCVDAWHEGGRLRIEVSGPGTESLAACLAAALAALT